MDAVPCLRQSPRMLETSLKTKIMNEVDRQFDDQTKVLADLVRIPSTRFQEAPAQDMMARLFKEDGLGVDRWQVKIDDLNNQGNAPWEVWKSAENGDVESSLGQRKATKRR